VMGWRAPQVLIGSCTSPLSPLCWFYISSRDDAALKLERAIVDGRYYIGSRPHNGTPITEILK